MSVVQAHARRAIPNVLAVLTLIGVGALLAGDASHRLFPAGAHSLLAALPLALIAVAHIVDQAVRRVSRAEWVKAAILALGFLLWAANQICSDPGVATLLNDFAIAAFIVDAFLFIMGWPSGSERGEAEIQPAGPPTGVVAERA
jgi:hypothetical protein